MQQAQPRVQPGGQHGGGVCESLEPAAFWPVQCRIRPRRSDRDSQARLNSYRRGQSTSARTSSNLPRIQRSASVNQLVRRWQGCWRGAIERCVPSGVEQLGQKLRDARTASRSPPSHHRTGPAECQREDRNASAPNISAIQRVIDVALELAHLAARLVADQPVPSVNGTCVWRPSRVMAASSLEGTYLATRNKMS